MNQTIPGYKCINSPAIAVPNDLHVKIPTMKGTTYLTPREILANDIRNMRKYTDAPNPNLQELIRLNKDMYPEVFKK